MLFQVLKNYWNAFLLYMQELKNQWMRWSNRPHSNSERQLQWKFLVEKGNSGKFCQNAGFCSTPRREWVSETKPWFRWWQLHWWQRRKASAIAIAPLSHSHLFQPVKDPFKRENRHLVWDISNRPLPDQYLNLESKTMLLESSPSFIKSRINLN